MRLNRIWPFSWVRKMRLAKRVHRYLLVKEHEEGIRAMCDALADMSRRQKEAERSGEEGPADRMLRYMAYRDRLLQ